jgi:hypothetical protein
MKKLNFLIFSLILLLFISNFVQRYQIGYLEYKIKNEMKRTHIIYSNNIACIDEVPEDKTKDIIYRIDVLIDHIHFNGMEKPSYDWINSVLLQARRELIEKL